MISNEIMSFLMNEQNFKYLGKEFSDGNMCHQLINFYFGREYFIRMYIFSTTAIMVLEQSTKVGIRTINSGSFSLDKKYKDSFRTLFRKITLELKRSTMNTRLEKMEKDFD